MQSVHESTDPAEDSVSECGGSTGDGGLLDGLLQAGLVTLPLYMLLQTSVCKWLTCWNRRMCKQTSRKTKERKEVDQINFQNKIFISQMI